MFITTKSQLTYRELLENLNKMPSERLDDTATVFVSEVSEYYPVMTTVVTHADVDVLDEGHWVLVI